MAFGKYSINKPKPNPIKETGKTERGRGFKAEEMPQRALTCYQNGKFLSSKIIIHGSYFKLYNQFRDA